jgi:hypothetical protein
MRGVVGTAIGTLPSLTRADYIHTGWTRNGVPVGSAFIVPDEGDFELVASWVPGKPAPKIVADFGTGSGAFTIVGGATAVAVDDSEGHGFTFTYGTSGNDWAWAKFTVDLGSNSLSDFKEVTMRFRGVSGDAAYKNISLFAADSIPSSQPINQTTYKVCTSSGNNHTDGGAWYDLTLTIDSAKGVDLTGVIEFIIFDSSAATGTRGGTGSPTAWDYRNVTFVPWEEAN